jgi:hypothetical protein
LMLFREGTMNRFQRISFMAGVLCGGLFSPVFAAVSLTVRETAGVARDNELVHNGIPLAKEDNITDARALSISGAPSAQFEVLSRWGGALNDTSKPIQWLLVTFPATVGAGAASQYQLTAGGAASGSLITRNSADEIEINTGAARFVVSKTEYSVLKGAYLPGNPTLNLVGGTGSGVIQTIDADSRFQRTMRALPPEGGVEVEHDGPLYVTLKVEGHYDNAPASGSPSAVAFRYVARYSFRKDSPVCEIDFYFAWPGSKSGEPGAGIGREPMAPVYGDRMACLFPNRVSLSLPLALSGPITGYAGADGRAGLSAVLASGQTARLSQRLRINMRDPAVYSLQAGTGQAAGGYAERPFVAVVSAVGGVGASLQKMKFYEPQSIEAGTDRLDINLVSEKQPLAPHMGAFAKAVIRLIPPGDNVEEVRAQTCAALDRPLIAWPSQDSVSRTKALGDLWNGTPDARASTYLGHLQTISNFTLSGYSDYGMHGFMTYGLTPRRYSSVEREGEATTSEDWFFNGFFTDYHSAFANVVRQFAVTGDPSLLHDLSFPAARRTLNTQIIQGNPTNTNYFIGWAPSGYGSYRNDPNSLHSYFENLYFYYYLTGDRKVIETLKVAGENMRWLDARTVRGPYVPGDTSTLIPPGQINKADWLGNAGRGASLRGMIYWFLGHAYDRSFIDDFRNEYERLASRNLGLPSAGGEEYAFISETDLGNVVASTTSITTLQLWMHSLYDTQNLWLLYGEYGDIPLGTGGVRISRIFAGLHRSFWQYASRVRAGGDGTVSGTWANGMNVSWTGPRVGGVILAVTDSGSPEPLFSNGKALVATLGFRASLLNGGDAGMRAQALQLYDRAFSGFSSAGRGWDKEISEYFLRTHDAIGYIANGDDFSSTKPPARPRRLRIR